MKAPLFIFLTCSLFLFTGEIFAQPVSSAELINRAKQYDGQEVTYAGEVIGDIMERGDYCWINTNDGKNALGIWAPKELASGILHSGSYKYKGDWIEIKGVFHRACPEHGGDLDIHALEIHKVAQGSQVKDEVNPVKKILFFTLAGVLIVIWISNILKLK